MNVRIIQVGYLNTNCYILEKEEYCLVIDPGDEFYAIQNQIGKNHLIAILITHRHPDHIGALEQLISFYHIPIYEFKNTEEKLYEIGPFHFEVIHTPGHTSDSISFYFEDYQILFDGDFIFKDTIGRTDLPTGNWEQMRESLRKISKYSDRIKICPGHGEGTKLGYEKEHNSFLQKEIEK